MFIAKNLNIKSIQYGIRTQIIKKYQQQLAKATRGTIVEYPKTFQGKVQLLNNPKTIKLLQIVQFGVKYKSGYKWLPIILLLAGVFGYIQQKALPTRVIDRYFVISQQSSQQYSGYFGAALMYDKNKPFYLYIPLLAVIYQMSRFISLGRMLILPAINLITNSLVGKYIVDQRLKKYEVWDQQRIMYGEGTLLSWSFAFWAMLGWKEGLDGLKSKIFLKTIPGLGIIRKGIPSSYFCMFYLLLESYFYYNNSKNEQLVGLSIVNGIIFGLIYRRWLPLLK